MEVTNPNSRLEAFCDGVFAIALTLLIIEIKIPQTIVINNTAEFWLALKDIAPSVFAFLLSFIIIFITWANHHSVLKLVNKSSPSFIYANGLLLLTVVFISFPTALLGQYIFTDHASPAVILYSAVLAIQAIGWILLSRTALRSQLTKNEKATLKMSQNGRNGYFAFVVYSLFAILAFWFPLPIAAVTTTTWVFWLIYGISIKHE